ncbi:uncharacterized protein cubi_00681 [Cryptosporidium ubiquitum]|uniref:Uncharacterized protein n=1 Tax=Cryptosporidium ubiquitum TaxID=857276 RepID=A0A1J4MCB5_9CRYT|nr:uncharacterized protein cubi_00681 [Cryptosporidium ubiquitum]OII71873.1 hypothetical protein cubi_00681 [Cryptosporidium ubiquitum]
METFDIKRSSATTPETLLDENEYIKENYKNCDVSVLDFEGKEKLAFLNHDILLTDYRIILVKDAKYSAQNSKIPNRFLCGGYIDISSIIVNAISSCEKAEDIPYLYIQIGSLDFNQEGDEDSEQSQHFSEINIHCSDHNAVYTLFNSISETAAYMEQLDSLSDSQTNNELTDN